MTDPVPLEPAGFTAAPGSAIERAHADDDHYARA